MKGVNIFFFQIVDRLLTFTYSGGKAPAQARSVETPASEPGHGSGNSTPKDAPKAEPYRSKLFWLLSVSTNNDF